MMIFTLVYNQGNSQWKKCRDIKLISSRLKQDYLVEPKVECYCKLSLQFYLGILKYLCCILKHFLSFRRDG